MPKEPSIHWNPPDEKYPEHLGETRCGEKLRTVHWRRNPDTVDCERCKWLIAEDRQKEMRNE